ncbi:MAG: hypothetical protein RL701_2830 [Pseudomonadota bacterium]
MSFTVLRRSCVLTFAVLVACRLPGQTSVDLDGGSAGASGTSAGAPSAGTGGGSGRAGASNSAAAGRANAGAAGVGLPGAGQAAAAGQAASSAGVPAAAPASRELQVVWHWGEVGDEAALPGNSWPSDSSLGAKAGELAVHSPVLRKDDPVSTTFDCGGAPHSQLSYYWRSQARCQSDTEIALKIDGQLRSTFRLDCNTDWKRAVFDVTSAAHTYTFTASSRSATSDAFALDSLVCSNQAPSPATGALAFEHAYIPSEITGVWPIDSAFGAESGDAALHSPVIHADESAAVTLDCGGAPHSQLTFSMRTEGECDSHASVELRVDGKPHTTFPLGCVTSWKKLTFAVPRAAHTYTFTAHSRDDTDAAFIVDSFAWVDQAALPSPGGVDFEHAYVPLELQGTWQVDNRFGAQSGALAVHSPLLGEGEEASMTFDCAGAAHSRLSFYWRSEARCGSKLAVSVLVDGTLRSVFPVACVSDWKQVTFEVPLAVHTYTFMASTPDDDEDGAFILDSLQWQ